MDWKDSLRSFLENNPDLPEGSIPEPETPAEVVVKPRHLQVTYEKKGRKGKPVTIIEGFAPDTDVAALASRLKGRLGVGGSADGEAILLQGDHRADALSLLKEWGISK